MKAVKWFAPHDMRMVEVEKPLPGPGQALVRVQSVGVCGSDMHYYEDGGIGAAKLNTPIILGHEFGGIVEAVGTPADASLVGCRVAVEPGAPCGTCEWCLRGHYNVCPKMQFPGGPGCDGALAEYIVVLARCCFPVPDETSSAVAAMVEPLAVAVHTVELAEVKPGYRVAILGLGPIGLLTAQVLRACGVSTIYGSDVIDYRVEVAAHYGVDRAFHAKHCDVQNEILALTEGRGVDVVFDCSRSSETPKLACYLACPGGLVVLTGISGTEEDPIAVGQARRKGLALRWCRRFAHNYPAALVLLNTGKVDVASLITHSFPLERAQEAFELVSRFGDKVLKASIDF